jgi:TRAP-type C4-dicarboxylate transport system permease large subunit
LKLIFGPLLSPMVGQFGIDPLHYGIVLVIGLSRVAFVPWFGLVTPRMLKLI